MKKQRELQNRNKNPKCKNAFADLQTAFSEANRALEGDSEEEDVVPPVEDGVVASEEGSSTGLRRSRRFRGATARTYAEDDTDDEEQTVEGPKKRERST